MWAEGTAETEPQRRPCQGIGDLGRPGVPLCSGYMSSIPCSDEVRHPPRGKDEGLQRPSPPQPPVSMETSVSASTKEARLSLSSRVVWVQSNGSGCSCRLVESDGSSASYASSGRSSCVCIKAC